MELPEEIVAYIFSFARANVTSLNGLQIAFTCKAQYDSFRPAIEARQLVVIREALRDGIFMVSTEHGQTILTVESAFCSFFEVFNASMTQGPEGMTDIAFGQPGLLFELRLYMHPNAELLWSLQSLFARQRPRSIQAARKRGFRFLVKLSMPVWMMVEDSARHEQALALVKLLGSLSGYEGCEVVIQGSKGKRKTINLDDNAGNVTATLQPSVPVQLTSLELDGHWFHPSTYLPFHSILLHSSTTLQRLSLTSGGLSAEQWDTLIPYWASERLSSVIFKDMELSVWSIATFLRRNANLKIAELLIWKHKESKRSDYPSIIPLPALVGSPEILAPLFGQSGISFPNLASLTITQKAYFERTRVDGAAEQLDRLSSVTAVLASINRRIPSMTMLSLELTHTLDLLSWLPEYRVQSSRASMAKTLKSFLRVDKSHQASPSGSDALRTALQALTDVTHLRFSVHQDVNRAKSSPPQSIFEFPPSTWVEPGYILGFISELPALKCAFLEGVFYRKADSVDTILWPTLARAWTACSKLERMEVCGYFETTDTVVWLRGEGLPVL